MIEPRKGKDIAHLKERGISIINLENNTLFGQQSLSIPYKREKRVPRCRSPA